MGNAIRTSACCCDCTYGNIKCKLLNAAENRRAKKPCRCLTRRPKCLMFRRKRYKCTCTHHGCINTVPPTPLGCGPPMKSPCNAPKSDKKIEIICGCPSPTDSPNMRYQRPSPKPVQKTITPKPPACQKPSSPKPPSPKPPICQKPSSPKPSSACRKPSPQRPTPKPGISTCQKSPTPSCKVTSKKVNTDSPKCKIASKIVNTESPRVERCGSPICPSKLIRCISTTTSTRSLSPEPEPVQKPIYICCGGSGQSPDRKNVCRFTVDAYFS